MSLKHYKSLVENRKARFQYEILETFEAGIELTGTEVKSTKAGRANLLDAFALVRNGELWLHNLHISPLDNASQAFNHDPTRRRKLLMHRREIDKLVGQIEQKGLTLVPLRLVASNSWIKVHLALGRGKKLFDKRRSLKDKQLKRDTARALKDRD